MHTNPEVIVVGGSFAGLSAALYLARSHFATLVIDAGKPRNRYAEASHGFLGQDGQDPAAILATARRQVQAYPEATFLTGEAIAATQEDGGFAVRLASGEIVRAPTLVLATGVTDTLPELPGLAERWGKSVAHCPFCHGYEFGGASLGVLATSPASLHQARLIPFWGPTTFFVNDALALSAEERAELTARGLSIEETPVAALEGPGLALEAVRLADGRHVPVGGLFVAPTLSQTSPLPAMLGCAFEDTMVGTIVQVGPDQQTSVPGVYAAGDMATMRHSVTFAVADGAMAAMGINQRRMAAA